MSKEKAIVTMSWKTTAKDGQGNIIWVDEGDNLIVEEGLNYLLSNDIPSATLYIGLTDSAPTPASGDTMASHAGWTEVTDYDEAARQAWGQGAASAGVTVNATSATFTNVVGTVGGGFLSTVATKGGSTGDLFSVKASNEGDRVMVAPNTLDFTVSLSVASA